MPRRDLGVEREIELAEAAAAAPGAKLLADGEGLGLHGASLAAPAAQSHYLRRNRQHDLGRR